MAANVNECFKRAVEKSLGIAKGLVNVYKISFTDYISSRFRRLYFYIRAVSDEYYTDFLRFA